VDARAREPLLDRFGEFADQLRMSSAGVSNALPPVSTSKDSSTTANARSMQAIWTLSDPIHYQALQHFITHSPWPAEPLWRRLAEVVPERRGILALDDTGCRSRAGTRSGSSGSTRARWENGQLPSGRVESADCEGLRCGP